MKTEIKICSECKKNDKDNNIKFTSKIYPSICNECFRTKYMKEYMEKYKRDAKLTLRHMLNDLINMDAKGNYKGLCKYLLEKSDFIDTQYKYLKLINTFSIKILESKIYKRS